MGDRKRLERAPMWENLWYSMPVTADCLWVSCCIGPFFRPAVYKILPTGWSERTVWHHHHHHRCWLFILSLHGYTWHFLDRQFLVFLVLAALCQFQWSRNWRSSKCRDTIYTSQTPAVEIRDQTHLFDWFRSSVVISETIPLSCRWLLHVDINCLSRVVEPPLLHSNLCVMFTMSEDISSCI